MSALATLKLSAAKKSQSTSPASLRRNKLSKKIWEQIELAKAQATGSTFTTTRFRTVKEDDGGRRSVQVPKLVRAWWWTAENGKLALNLRYGARVIEIAKGKSAVEVGSASELVPTLELLKKAVEGGELDVQIESASIKLREAFGK
jgi:hypothetical protein